MYLSDEGPTLETLDFTIRIGSTPTFLYFDLYLNTTHAQHTAFMTRKPKRPLKEGLVLEIGAIVIIWQPTNHGMWKADKSKQF